MIDQQLKTRILTTLGWMVADARNRADDCRQNNEFGSEGGYSPQLCEAIALYEYLSQEHLPGIDVAGTWTEQDCKDIGIKIGLPELKSSEFYFQYSRQGWKLGNGNPIVDLTAAMVFWRNNQHKFGNADPEPIRKTCLGVTPRQADIAKYGR